MYAKRDGLNAYRKEHGEPIYEVKPNAIANILNTINTNVLIDILYLNFWQSL